MSKQRNENQMKKTKKKKIFQFKKLNISFKGRKKRCVVGIV
jgi:hypothetical protein